MTKIMKTSGNKISVAMFMSPTYFDLKRSYHDKSRKMYCFVVDKQKFNEMNEQQMKDAEQIIKLLVPYDCEKSLKDLISSVFFEAENLTLLFEMSDAEGFDPTKEVNVCFYDSYNNEILTRQNRWNKNHPYNAGTEQYPDESWKGRKQLYTEWERIGETLFDK